MIIIRWRGFTRLKTTSRLSQSFSPYFYHNKPLVSPLKLPHQWKENNVAWEDIPLKRRRFMLCLVKGSEKFTTCCKMKLFFPGVRKKCEGLECDSKHLSFKLWCWWYWKVFLWFGGGRTHSIWPTQSWISKAFLSVTRHDFRRWVGLKSEILWHLKSASPGFLPQPVGSTFGDAADLEPSANAQHSSISCGPERRPNIAGLAMKRLNCYCFLLLDKGETFNISYLRALTLSARGKWCGRFWGSYVNFECSASAKGGKFAVFESICGSKSWGPFLICRLRPGFASTDHRDRLV